MRAFPAALSWKALECCFRVADRMLVPQLLIRLNQLFKPQTRRMTERKIALARTVFGAAIDYSKVRLDERAMIGCRRYRFAYVGFQVINSWGALSDPLLIHELVHVWQYQRLGSVYIPRALWAQRTPEGYNYGGVNGLRQALARGKNLLDFNYEQQGDIVADFFCLRTQRQPRWCAPDPAALPVFERIIFPCFRPEDS